MDVSRRAILRGRFSEVTKQTGRGLLPPPWFIASAAQAGDCVDCSACVDTCPSKILEISSEGLAGVNFQIGECDFCGQCARSCPQPFFKDSSQLPAWDLTADIDERCLSQQGVVCQICKEMCPVQAIQLTITIGRAPTPSIQQDLCNGCGACVAPCPTAAIVIQPSDDVECTKLTKDSTR